MILPCLDALAAADSKEARPIQEAGKGAIMKRAAKIAIVTVASIFTLVVTILGVIEFQLRFFGREIYETHPAGFVALCGISLIPSAGIAFCVAYSLTKALPSSAKMSN